MATKLYYVRSSSPIRRILCGTFFRTPLLSILLLTSILSLIATPVFANRYDPMLSEATELQWQMNANTSAEKPDCVVLLHGLARRAASMNDMKKALEGDGFLVANIDYPSRKKPIEELSPVVGEGADACAALGGGTVHFVAHSLGGIMIRHYLTENEIEKFGRAVFLGPPNNGSEVVDAMRDVPGYVWLNGPAGLQLGTDEKSVPLNLGPVEVDVAVIAGTSSINLILSTHLPDPDDGKVSVASARLDGMCAMLEVAVAHPFLMTDENILPEVSAYLSTGRFISDTAEYPECGHAFKP